jgi:hypothetical protein
MQVSRVSNSPDERGRGYSGWRAGDDPGSTSSRPARGDRQAGPTRFFFLVPFRSTERGLEWRDTLGCIWLVGLVLIATAYGWLVSVGVQQGDAAFGALVAVAALLVLFYLGARGARPLS